MTFEQIKNILGKRVLLTPVSDQYKPERCRSVLAGIVEEISPSGKYFKFTATSFSPWNLTTEYILLEVLPDSVPQNMVIINPAPVCPWGLPTPGIGFPRPGDEPSPDGYPQVIMGGSCNIEPD